MLLRMALYNLAKHRRRTVLIVFAVLVSVLVMELMSGMFQGIRINFMTTLTEEGGHIRIRDPRRDSLLNPWSLDYPLQDYTTTLEAIGEITAGIPLEGEEVLPFGAMLQSAERTVTLAGVGLRRDSSFYRAVARGMVAGEFPPQDGTVVISRALAELLQVTPEDDLLVVVEDSTGSPFYLQYPLGGIFETASPDLDENTFFIGHRDAQDLLYLEGDTMEIRIRLQDPGAAEGVAARLREGLPEVEVQTYRDIHGGLVQMIEMMDFFILFMNLLVVIVAASVITNAILMNVFERPREFGTMRAIGMKRRGIVVMILLEGVIQGGLGALAGLAVGIPVVLYLSTTGIDMGGVAEAFGMGSSVFTFAWVPRSSAFNALGGVLVALAGSLYAALAARRLSIMEALQYD